jgi:hypothetical protein
MRRPLMPPTALATRADVLRVAGQLRREAEQRQRAARLLEAHAQRCTDPTAPAHAEALRRAGGMLAREGD